MGLFNPHGQYQRPWGKTDSKLYFLLIYKPRLNPIRKDDGLNAKYKQFLFYP